MFNTDFIQKKKKVIKNQERKLLVDSYLESKTKALHYFSNFNFKPKNNHFLIGLSVLTLFLSTSLIYYSLNVVNGSVLGEFDVATNETNFQEPDFITALSGKSISPCEDIKLNFQDSEFDLNQEATVVLNLKNLDKKVLTNLFAQQNEVPSKNFATKLKCDQKEGNYLLEAHIIYYQENQQNYIFWESLPFEIKKN